MSHPIQCRIDVSKHVLIVPAIAAPEETKQRVTLPTEL